MNLSFETDMLMLAEPKYRFSIGSRILSGAKADFSGTGQVSSELRIGEETGSATLRRYHDGAVGNDLRTISIDDGNGGTVSVPITADGLTDNWRYSDARQVQPDGTVAMHSYVADIMNGGPRQRDPKSTYGLDLVVNRDVGRLTPRINWSIIGGLSLNGISSNLNAGETAKITTVTDAYSLAGASAPEAPFQSRITKTEPAFDANGNPILSADGSPVTRQIDNTVLIADAPQTRVTSVTTSSTSITNRFRLRGAFFTLRVGPTVIFPITQKLRATLSLGAALAFAGTEYEVMQEFLPDTAESITDTVIDREARLLPGYFADANLEYTLTDRTGFYAGAAYQSTSSYTQKIESPTVNYSTTVDLTGLSGFSFGMNVKF